MITCPNCRVLMAPERWESRNTVVFVCDNCEHTEILKSLVGPEEKLERVFSEDLERELLNHKGKWVALVCDPELDDAGDGTHNRILVVGESLSEVWETAKEQGYEEPLLHHVPDSPFFYIMYSPQGV